MRRIKWRPWLRALHRDFGYFAVGLTFVYALSGLAVNHIADWDPNFKDFSRHYHVTLPIPKDEKEAAQAVLAQLGQKGPPQDAYLASDQLLDIIFEHRTLHVDLKSGDVLEEGQKPRFLLRVANWLHLNRGKKAWTMIADGYAVFLLFLASSGLFMIPGRKGFFGRGLIVAICGALVPTLYVVLSGGP